jgi:hypothetical protein
MLGTRQYHAPIDGRVVLRGNIDQMLEDEWCGAEAVQSDFVSQASPIEQWDAWPSMTSMKSPRLLIVESNKDRRHNSLGIVYLRYCQCRA